MLKRERMVLSVLWALMMVMTATAQEPAGFPQPSPAYKKLGAFGSVSVGRIAVSILIFLVCFAFVVQPQTQAQSKTRITAEVSVQELQVPAKAHQAVLQGVECMRKGDVAGSLSHFKRAIQKCPSYPQAYYLKGLAEIRLDQPNEASQSFQKAIDLSGGHYALAYFGYAQALVLLERPKDAEAISRRGLEEGSSLSEGYTVLSFTLVMEHRLDEAEQMAQKAVRMPDPLAWKALPALAYIHAKKKDYETAVHDLESYLQHLRSEGDKGLIQQVEKELSNLKTRLSAQEPARIVAQSPD
jgi:tetratricopeptide (TPR) repeat protein